MTDITHTEHFLQLHEIDVNDHTFASWYERTGSNLRFEVRRFEDGEAFVSAFIGSSRCDNCGEWLKWGISEEGVIGVTNPCTLPNGITVVTELDVPSGKLVVADDLRPMYDFDIHILEYSSLAGQAKSVELMAEVGCAYGPLSNCSAVLYDRGNGTYAIADLGWDEEDERPTPAGWSVLASIDTRLFAYSLADYDDYVAKRKACEASDDPEVLERLRGEMPAVVEVPPGRYRFTYHGAEETIFRDEIERPVLWAEFERVG